MNKNVSLTIRNLRENLVKFVNCGEYSITKELHAEINGITSALDSLKLDYMFLSNLGLFFRCLRITIILKFG